MIYIDKPMHYPHAKYKCKWSHVWSDNIEELHLFARKLRLKKEWFQNRRNFPHYDVTEYKYTDAIQHGAILTDLKKWVKKQIELGNYKIGK